MSQYYSTLLIYRTKNENIFCFMVSERMSGLYSKIYEHWNTTLKRKILVVLENYTGHKITDWMIGSCVVGLRVVCDKEI